MKTMRMPLVIVGAIIAATFASGQTVDTVFVGKQHTYTQVDNSTVSDVPGNPWGFHASVEGSGLSGETPSITLAGGSGSTTFSYDAGDGEWKLESNYADSTALDAAYNSGSYSITILSQTISVISLTGDSFPTAPLASLSGGTISGGVLTWNPNTALTITIGGSGIDHMGIYVFGQGYNNGAEGFGVSTQSFTVPAFSLTGGQSYTVELSFDDVVGGTEPFTFNGSGGMSSVSYAGAYTSQTKFTIQAVPEPAAYAAILGALTLVGAIVLRRRQLV
ncbi:MAG: PEP-CTERM sorting domain-containing protein [Opitutaceae bacterium]|nr:PEP-CTERM sorting domain-containing protein [Opitutaceae bacterium]